MRASHLWIAGGSLLAGFVACSSQGGGLPDNNNNDLSSDDGGSGGGSSGGLSSGGTSSSSTGFNFAPPPPPKMYEQSPCKAGTYEGSFTGSYSSHITAVGIPIPVTGNVQLTLNQREGGDGAACTIVVEGEGAISEKCANVFDVSGGVIQGTADGLFPYFCTLTGTLDCGSAPKLDNGWMECTYCAIGVILDAGLAPGQSLVNCVGAGGNFAGPLTANYNTSTLSLTGGAWNGSETLCDGIAGTSTASCNDGGSPGPEGGPPTNYLALDGGYGGPGSFGGSGAWSASCVNCPDQ